MPPYSFLCLLSGFSIFFKCTSISLFTDSTFYQNVNNFHEYLTQHSLKSGGTKDHFIERPALSLSFPQAHIDIYSMYQDTRFYGHKIYGYKFCTRTRKTSNQNVISNYGILIGRWILTDQKNTVIDLSNGGQYNERVPLLC